MTMAPLNIVHLKGFGEGLRWADIGAVLPLVLKWLDDNQVNVVCFDGDPSGLKGEVRGDSFTSVIDAIASEREHILLVAFVSTTTLNHRVPHFLDVYSRDVMVKRTFAEVDEVEENSLIIIPIDVKEDWARLGELALKQTQSTSILCIGGGATIQSEYSLVSKDITWHFYDIPRISKAGCLEWGALHHMVGAVPSNIKRMPLP